MYAISRRRRRCGRLRRVLDEARLASLRPDGHDRREGVHGVHPIRQRGYLAFPLRHRSRRDGRSVEPAADEPLLQLVREPRRLHFSVNDGLWVRLLDVGAALEARTYRSDGRIVFEVEDRFRPDTGGRYELVVEGGTVRCGRTETDADLVGTVNALGATYLGGVSFRQLWWAGQVEERTPGSLERADAMFGSTPAPWCVVDSDRGSARVMRAGRASGSWVRPRRLGGAPGRTRGRSAG